MELKAKIKKLYDSDRAFMIVLAVFAVVMVCLYNESSMNVQNMTAYLLSYKYGLIPRAFVGSCIDVLCRLFHLQLTYKLALMISTLATVVYFVVLFWLYYLVLKHVNAKYKTQTKMLIVIFSIIFFSEFVSWNNFGRLDEYLMIITLLCVLLLVIEKAEFLVVPLCLIACLVHVGFAFTNSGIILAILFWKATKEEKKLNKKYTILFLLSFLVISVAFIYMEALRQPVTMGAYKEVEANAIRMAQEADSMDYLPTVYSLLDSELLMRDVYDAEALWHSINKKEVPVFVVLFLPYIVIAVRFIYRLIKRQTTLWHKLRYAVLGLGFATIIPELILKVDYGRWVYCIIAYFGLLLLAMHGMNESCITEIVREDTKSHAGKMIWLLLAIYLFLFIPFRDVLVCDFTYGISVSLFGM